MRNLLTKYNWKLPLVCLLLFLSLIGGMYFYYVNDVRDAASKPQITLGNTVGPENVGELAQGRSVSQTFQYALDELDGIRLYFVNFNRENEGSLSVSLYRTTKNSWNLIQSWSFDTSTVDGNMSSDFMLDKPLTSAEGSYEIVVDGVDGKGGSCVSIQLSDSDMYREGHATVNGKTTVCDLAFGVYGKNTFLYTWYFTVFGAMLVFFVLLCAAALLKTKLHRVFVIAGLGVGLLYIAVFPPYSSPDEYSHIATSYANANTLLGNRAADRDGYPYIRETDLTMDSQEIQPDLATYEKVWTHIGEKPDSIAKTTYDSQRLDISFFAHLPQSLGVAAAWLLGLNGVAALYVGRLFMLFFYLACGYFAIRIMPFAKTLMFLVYLSPIALYNAASFSYDGVVLSVCFLMTACYLSLIYSRQRVTWADILLLIALAVLSAPIKVVYLLIALLGFLVPMKKFRRKISYFIMNIGSIAGGLAGILIQRASSITGMASSGYGGGQGAGYTLWKILGDIPGFLELCVNTLVTQGKDLFSGMVGQVFHWADIEISWVVSGVFVLLLIVSVFTSAQEEAHMTMKVRLISLVICLGVIGGILVTFTLSWTPLSLDYIDGIQGRYFLPILPLFLLLFQNRFLPLKERPDHVLVLGLFAVQYFPALDVFTTIISR